MEKVFTANEYCAWLREQARLKRPYWYGCYYNKCTEALLQRKAKQYPAHYTARRMGTYRKHIAAGQIAGDCVNGAIKGAVWSELGKREPKYGSHDCPDKSADGMFAHCKLLKMPFGKIATIPDKKGIAVRFAGHVGIYVGNGEVVEWRGFNYGCVVTKLSARPWTDWYEIPWCDYDSAENEPEQPKAEECPYKEPTQLIRKGSKGDGVAWVQWHLLKWNSNCLPKYGIDSDFGSETLAAVKAFQKEKALEVDGIVGKYTRAALKNI